jgi:hypothetical protein
MRDSMFDQHHDDEGVIERLRAIDELMQEHRRLFEGYSCRPPAAAFADALGAGRLSHDPAAPNYAGNYMYMFTDAEGRDHFKTATRVCTTCEGIP